MTDDLETAPIIDRQFPVARWLTIAAGAWLFASSWVWERSPSERANSVIVGVAMTAIAFYAMFLPALRRLNTALAVWLLISTAFVFHHASRATLWNEVIVALVVGAASLAKDDQRLEWPRSGRALTRRNHF